MTLCKLDHFWVGNSNEATIVSITTLRIKGSFVTLSINNTEMHNTQHNKTVIMLSVIMLSVEFNLLLC